MCKKLLTFVIAMSMVSFASAQIIDDFESYNSTAELRAVWVDDSQSDQGNPGTSVGTSYAVATLVDTGVNKAMLVSFVIPGGWDYPDAAAPWEAGYVKEEWESTSGTATIARAIDPMINLENYANEHPNWQLTFKIKPLGVGTTSDLADLNLWGDYPGSDNKKARTLIPMYVDTVPGDGPSPEQPGNGLQWWYPASAVPATVGPTTDLTGTPWEGLPNIPLREWGTIITDTDRQLPWDWWTVPWQTITALNEIQLMANSDTFLGLEFMRECEGGDLVPPQGGIYSFIIDDIQLVPEPATIALLGLGGLSLLRIRKRR